MRKLLLYTLILSMWILLAACAQSPISALPTSTSSQGNPTTPPTGTTPGGTVTPVPAKTPVPTSPLGEQPPFDITPIRKFLASQLNLLFDQVTLISWQPVDWRDSCLGVHKKGEMCLDVITPGYTFTFQTGTTTTVVNTNATGKYYRLSTAPESPGPLPGLSWTQSGGIAGICKNLSVYSTGAYWLRDCKAGKDLSQGVLSDTQQAYISELFDKYGPFVWKPLPIPGSADMFMDEIIFNGTGSSTMTADEQNKLDQYLAQLASDLVGSTDSTGTTSGITGQVMIGPTCGGPISLNNATKCADKPYQATITVLDQAGKTVMQFTTDADGRFRVPLQPGTYTLKPNSSVMPRAAEQIVQVVSGQYLMVTIKYDSGMR